MRVDARMKDGCINEGRCMNEGGRMNEGGCMNGYIL